MRIGDKSNFLCIERLETSAAGPAWRCEATAATGGWKCAVVHDQVIVAEAEEALKQTLDFSILQTPRVDIALSESGWVRITRDIRGRIIVRYRLGRLRAGAAVEGEVVLGVERGDEFCKHLISLLSHGT